MKEIKKLKNFIWSIFLLVIGLTLFLIGYSKIALVLILFGLFGIIWRVYESRKEVKLLSIEWTNTYIIIMILALISSSLIFEREWRTIDIILCGIVLMAIYLWFRLVPKLIEKGNVS